MGSRQLGEEVQEGGLLSPVRNVMNVESKVSYRKPWQPSVKLQHGRFGPKPHQFKLVPFPMKAYGENFTSSSTYKSLLERPVLKRTTKPPKEKPLKFQVNLKCNCSSEVSCNHEFEECKNLEEES
jgi:hypothetical protein